MLPLPFRFPRAVKHNILIFAAYGNIVGAASNTQYPGIIANNLLYTNRFDLSFSFFKMKYAGDNFSKLSTPSLPPPPPGYPYVVGLLRRKIRLIEGNANVVI